MTEVGKGFLLGAVLAVGFLLGRGSVSPPTPSLLVVGDDPRPCAENTWVIDRTIMCVSGTNHFVVWTKP
jgi:hypothetical protein